LTDIFTAGRQTGRTSRMIDAAVEQAENGHHCYVVCASQREVVRLNQAIASRECSHPERVHVIPAHNARIDWNDLRVYGASFGEQTYFDHYALENRYGSVLREWSRFNLAPEEPAAESDDDTTTEES
jgi:hypothetical protein